MKSLARNTVKSSKSLAQAIAKQIAQEPAEILKDVKEQTFGLEASGQPNSSSTGLSEGQQKQVGEREKLHDKLKSTRQVEALNRELTDIRKQDLFKDLQRRIAEGEDVPVSDYSELSMDQKQVLLAQKEAVYVQASNAKSEKENSLAEPAVKKGRQLFNFGKKTAMKREQTHVEKPVPPSG